MWQCTRSEDIVTPSRPGTAMLNTAPMKRIIVKLVGDIGVGKRSLMHAAVDRAYEDDTEDEEVSVELPSGKRLYIYMVRCARRLMRRRAADLRSGAGGPARTL